MEREHAVDPSPVGDDREVQYVCNYISSLLSELNAHRVKNKPCAVGPAGDERVDEEFMAVAGGDVERSVTVLVHTIDLPA